MIKVKANQSNDIFLNLIPDSVNVNSNSFLMVLDNQQTRKQQSAIITKPTDDRYITSRSVKCDINEINLSFPGSVAYCNLDNCVNLLTNQTGFTIAFTAKSNADDSQFDWENIVFAENNATTGNEFKIGIQPDGGGIVLSSHDGQDVVGEGWNDNRWHRVVVTRHTGVSKKLKVYVDGKHIGNSSANFNPVWNDTEKMTLGSEWDGATNNDFFKGNLKNFQLWDIEFTQVDVTYDFHNQGSVAWENPNTERATKGSLKAHFKLNEGTLRVINNSYYSNLIDHPSDFREWTPILCDVEYNVGEDKNGNKNRSSLLTIGEFVTGTVVGQPAIQILTRDIPQTGTWKFSMYIKGVGNTTSKKGRLNVNLGTADGPISPTIFSYAEDGSWQLIEGSIVVTQVGNVTIDFEPVIPTGSSELHVGDQCYIYGAKFYSTTYDINGTIYGGEGSSVPEDADWETEKSPMFELQDNTFYNYEVYEQTSSTNTDKYDDSVLGLRESGKLFVSGKNEGNISKTKRGRYN